MKVLLINKVDSVAVAPFGLKKGECGEFDGGEIVAREDIPAGHKIAVKDVAVGKPVLKYGYKIGVATRDISAGEWVHSHNLRSDLSCENNSASERVNASVNALSRTFYGYKRKGGKVGVRNDILVLPTVGCAVKSAEKIADEFKKRHGDFGGEPLVAAHPYGCSQLGEDASATAAVLTSLAYNPNFGGVLVVSLGCENNDLSVIKPHLGSIDKERIKYLVLQNCTDETEEGVRLLEELAEVASGDKREECDFSSLVIGVKCGGSDGASGITANPLVGRISDELTSSGGSVIMTEIPETFGAEQTLFARCENPEKLDEVIKNFKQYYVEHGEPIGENPSPGNKAGGITTNEEKSLGCVLKSGFGEIKSVIGYGERVFEKGVTVLVAPGNDLVSLSGLASAGATIALFTTGRGTPLGSLIPVIKISTNTPLYEKKSGWIDYDGGKVLEIGFDTATDELTEEVIAVANGKKTKSELGGHREFAIWKNGVTL